MTTLPSAERNSTSTPAMCTVPPSAVIVATTRPSPAASWRAEAAPAGVGVWAPAMDADAHTSADADTSNAHSRVARSIISLQARSGADTGRDPALRMIRNLVLGEFWTRLSVVNPRQL
jgi:hypothetical protein